MAQLKLAAGHPQGLMTLFFSEMWERFCYYGMRVLLTLFLVKSLLKGDADAALIYGAYTALIYAAPVLGGKMADQYLGYRYAILLGAVLMAIGEFLIGGRRHRRPRRHRHKRDAHALWHGRAHRRQRLLQGKHLNHRRKALRGQRSSP